MILDIDYKNSNYPLSMYLVDNNMYFHKFRIIFFVIIVLLCYIQGCISSHNAQNDLTFNRLRLNDKYNIQAEQFVSKAHIIYQANQKKMFLKAVEFLNKALKLEPNYPQALKLRGMILTDLGYLEDAFDDFTKAIRLQPTSEMYTARARYMLISGNYLGASKDLHRALTLNPQCIEAKHLQDILIKKQKY